MPDPDTDISSNSADFRHDIEGPDEDDAEASFEPDAIEASRARELGLGLGYKELNLQHDAESAGAPTADGDVEVMTPDQIAKADADNDG